MEGGGRSGEGGGDLHVLAMKYHRNVTANYTPPNTCAAQQSKLMG